MNHKGTITLETNRLILRRFRLDDAQAMYDNWASDPEVTKFLTWPIHGNVEISRSILQSWIDAYADNDTYQWAIVLKKTGISPSAALQWYTSRKILIWYISVTASGEAGGIRESHRKPWQKLSASLWKKWVQTEWNADTIPIIPTPGK